MHAVQTLRERLAVPIIGVEPGLKPAAAASRSKVVGVLATANTLKSAKFNRLLTSLGNESRFLCEAGVGLVPLIEQGDVSSDTVRQTLGTLLSPMLEAGADTLVLGCTHYPLVLQHWLSELPPHVTVLDTGAPVAEQTYRRLLQSGQLRQPSRFETPAPSGRVSWFTTGEVEHLERAVHHWLPEASGPCQPLPKR